MIQKLIVNEEHRGKRADIAVGEYFPKLSRAFIKKLFTSKQITMDSEAVKPGHKLRLGEVLTIDFDEASLDQIPDIELPVIFEDDNVIVINKPVGVISHSRGRYWNEPSVASFVRQKTLQEGERAGIVHRLDRATSGVIICSKNAETLRHLQRQFSQRTVKKTYYAIVDGHLKLEKAIIDMPIERNPKAPATFRVGSNGKPATTVYEVVESGKKHDLVKLTPTTGRTHQLRVHLQQQGYPICGDTLYGGSKHERLYLHAYSLEITLPNSERRTFTAELPDDFKELIRSHA